MIRMCLYLRHLSSGVYETLCLSKAVVLPSHRTLRDYTHHTMASTGFSTDIDAQLIKMANLSSCSERGKYVIILVDEMHIKQSIVYEKHTGIMPICIGPNTLSNVMQVLLHLQYVASLEADIGFTNLGELNSHLLEYEITLKDSGEGASSLASSMLRFSITVCSGPLFSSVWGPAVPTILVSS